MAENNKDGAYVIQEQGDLGLGTTPISSDYVKYDKNGNPEIPKNDEKPSFMENN